MKRAGKKQPYRPAGVTLAVVADYDASRWDRKPGERSSTACESGPATLGEVVRFIADDDAHERYLVERANRSENRDELIEIESRVGRQLGLEPLAPGDPLYEFAERVFDGSDPWQRLSVKEAADLAGVSKGYAMSMVIELKALGCWPYRPDKKGARSADEAVEVPDLRGAA